MKKSELKLTYREADFDVNIRKDGEAEVTEIRVSVSSELPYSRELWDAEKRAFVRGYEVLGHADGEIDFGRMKDGLVIQDTHWGDQVGLMKDIEVKDGKLTGNIIFGCGERSQEIMKDALAGIRRNMSVGYRVFEFKKDGVAEDGLPIFRAVKWQPYEASFVNVPADTDVGVGRSLEETIGDGEEPTATIKGESVMDKPETPVAVGVTADEVRSIFREELAKKPEMPEAKRFEQFDESARAEIGKRYNMMNVIRSLINPFDKEIDVGFEREVSDEIARQSRRSAKGMFIPDCVLTRAFDKGNTAAGLIGTETLYGSMIDALVAETVLGKAGVTVLDGLVGDIAIPKGNAATAYWIAEGADAQDAGLSVGQVLGAPKTVGAYTDISRKLLVQSGISAQSFVIDALRGALARAIETAAFSGTGSNGQPTGLDKTTGVQSVSMTAGAPTKADMVQFWAKLAAANVNGNKYFIGSPAVKALLAGTYDVVENTTNGRYLCEDGKVEGYDFLMSNLCNNKKLYFGDFSQMVLAFWSGIDLTVDTNSLSKSGGVRVVALQDCDVLIRHPEAFAVGTALA